MIFFDGGEGHGSIMIICGLLDLISQGCGEVADITIFCRVWFGFNSGQHNGG